MCLRPRSQLTRRGDGRSAYSLYDGSEDVPGATFSADQLRPRALPFELPVKAPHVHVDRAIVDLAVVKRQLRRSDTSTQ